MLLKYMKKLILTALTGLFLTSMIACAAPEPEIVIKEVVVEKIVKEPVEVIKEVPVEVEVINEVVVIKEVQVEKQETSPDETLSGIRRKGYEDSARLVSTEWLAKYIAPNINDINLVIIDVRKKEAYDEGHIPGAVHLTPGEVFQQEIDGVKGMLPKADHIAKALSSIGATPDSTILIYDGIKNLWATRGLWALDVYGHKNTILLDGVWTKWAAEGRQISTQIPTIKASSYKFSGSPNTSIIAGWEEVLDSIGDPSKLVCDSRSTGEYSGKNVRADSDRGGHIPESINLEWVKSSNDQHEFLNASQLQSIYDEVGLTDGKTIFTLCQTAVRATHSWFVLHDLLGYDNVKVYDGSWIEWGNNQDLPLETGG